MAIPGDMITKNLVVPQKSGYDRLTVQITVWPKAVIWSPTGKSLYNYVPQSTVVNGTTDVTIPLPIVDQGGFRVTDSFFYYIRVFYSTNSSENLNLVISKFFQPLSYSPDVQDFNLLPTNGTSGATPPNPPLVGAEPAGLSQTTKAWIAANYSSGGGGGGGAVSSVAGRTGAVTLTKSDVNLANVDNTSDASKPVSTAAAAALAAKADLVGGVIPTAQIPSIALGTSVPVANQAAMLALTGAQVQPGDLAVRGDGAGTFMLMANPPSTLSNWQLLPAPTGVTSVNSQTGIVVLGKTDIGLGNLDNTSDANKPVSTAQAAAIALKANSASPTFTGTVSGVTKAHVGLGNVTNTADADKPVSTAQQAALDLKANAANPAFTGTATGLTKAMVGLGSVDNTADTAKPVSTAQQTALDLKANAANPAFSGTPTGLTKAHVGLGNVDNTADTAKPVSTAQQTALDLKANAANPTFSGTVTVGTATAGTNTTAAASTAFVQTAVSGRGSLVSGKQPIAELPAGSIVIAKKVAGTWPARPTTRTDITVDWEGVDPSPSIVANTGTGGMYDGDRRSVVVTS